MNQLHKIGSEHSSFLKQPFNLGGSIKNLDDIEEMLKLEKAEFEVSFLMFFWIKFAVCLF